MLTKAYVVSAWFFMLRFDVGIRSDTISVQTKVEEGPDNGGGRPELSAWWGRFNR